MTSSPPQRTLAGLSDRALLDLLEELRAEREALARQRRRNLVIGAAAFSLLVHLVILWYLSFVERRGAGSPGGEAVAIEFALVDDTSLTHETFDRLAESSSEALPELASEAAASPSLEAAVRAPSVQLGAADSGAVESLTGAGSGAGGTGLSGGAANATFFGISSKGRRFAFIVDVSGSMSEDGRMNAAMSELVRSIRSLPDFASYFIVLYSTMPQPDPTAREWTRAREPNLRRTEEWLRTISPGGGTQPLPAFQLVFSLDVAPDVIFFMTDGQIPAETPAAVRAMRERRPQTVVNSIAFGEPGAHDPLRQIAEESGGIFRYVPTGGDL